MSSSMGDEIVATADKLVVVAQAARDMAQVVGTEELWTAVLNIEEAARKLASAGVWVRRHEARYGFLIDERQGKTVDDGTGPHPYDVEFCSPKCLPT